MGPAADVEEDPGAAPTRIGAAWQAPAVRAAALGPAADRKRPRRRGRLLAGVGVAVLVLSGGGALAYRKVAHENRLDGAPPAALPTVVPSPGPSGIMGPAVVLPAPGASRTSSAPASQQPTRTTAARPAQGTFVLVDDVSDITIRTGRLDRGIVDVSVPDGSDARPRTDVDGGTVKLGIRDGGRHTDLDVRLDSRVTWAIRFEGGARHMSVDLSGTHVRSVTFDGGAARIDLRLPGLDDTLPIAMNGGVHQWRIVTDGPVGVRVQARRGGGDVELYGRDRGGLGHRDRVSVDGGTGIDVQASAGFGALTVAGA